MEGPRAFAKSIVRDPEYLLTLCKSLKDETVDPEVARMLKKYGYPIPPRLLRRRRAAREHE